MDTIQSLQYIASINTTTESGLSTHVLQTYSDSYVTAAVITIGIAVPCIIGGAIAMWLLHDDSRLARSVRSCFSNIIHVRRNRRMRRRERDVAELRAFLQNVIEHRGNRMAESLSDEGIGLDNDSI